MNINIQITTQKMRILIDLKFTEKLINYDQDSTVIQKKIFIKKNRNPESQSSMLNIIMRKASKI